MRRWVLGLLAAATIPSAIYFTATGGVKRLISSKLADTISVKDFGAVGDWNGSTGTDNTVAVNNAAGAAGSITGVVFPCPGTYHTTDHGNIACAGGSEIVQPGSGSRSPFINVRAAPYFAVGDGVADDTAAIQAAATALKGSAGRNLLIPAGTYLISSQLLFNRLVSMKISGDGNRNTILRWTGAAGGTAFLFQNAYRITVEGIRFDAPTNNPDILVEIREDKNQSDYDSTAPSQLNTFRECTFKNGGVGISVGLPAGAVAGDDIMNDTHLFSHNIADGQTVANAQITGSNALNIGFEYNYFTGAPVAVQVLASPGGGGGTFNWMGGYVASTSINFDIQSVSTDGCNIRKVRSESSPRFLSVSSNAVSMPITIDSVFYSSASLNADTFAINALGGGPFTIRGSMWGSAGSGTPPVLKFATPSPTEVVLEGNAFEVPGSDATAHVSATNVRVFDIGSRCKTAGLARVICSNDLIPSAVVGSFVTVTYASGGATSLGAPDLTAGSMFKTVATTNAQFGFANPTGGTLNQRWCAQIKNTSGGALNAASPYLDTKFRATAWVSPATGKNQVRCFFYDSAADVHYEISNTGDLAN